MRLIYLFVNNSLCGVREGMDRCVRTGGSLMFIRWPRACGCGPSCPTGVGFIFWTRGGRRLWWTARTGHGRVRFWPRSALTWMSSPGRAPTCTAKRFGLFLRFASLPLIHGPLVKKLKRAGVLLYNADIHLVQNYHYERGHFPLAFGQFDFHDGRLSHFYVVKTIPGPLIFPCPPFGFCMWRWPDRNFPAR
jgi:hypothetical protein